MLPADASCEDLEVDASLAFLSSFVQAALQNGAAPYISEADRIDMGAVRPSHQDAAVDHSQGLRFTAYERQGAPEPVTVRTISRDPSPVRGTPYTPQRRAVILVHCQTLPGFSVATAPKTPWQSCCFSPKAAWPQGLFINFE